MRYLLIISLLLSGICTTGMAADADKLYASNTIFKSMSSPETYDSLLSRWHTGNVANNFDTFFNEFINLESDSTLSLESLTPDSIYQARLQMLLSPIHLPYNDVIKKYLIAYTTKRKATMGYVIGRAQYYFPIIEQELIKENLPVELRMLPVIESALIPSAISRAGAAGLWQFMYATGKSYNLEITSYVDERRDPYAATKAACRYLSDLYKLYNDWTLALAAYNCGPGNVNKALKRAGDGATTYWDIYPYLPKETRGYIPSFVAATYAYTFHKQHDIELIAPPVPLSTDTVHISRLTHFGQISSTLNTPIELLRELNPQYKLDIIPAIDKSYSLVLPQVDVTRYLDKISEIDAKDTLYLAKYLKSPAIVKRDIALANTTAYRVKSGDTLGAIARRNGVTVTQLLKWNGLKTTSVLRIGQRIEINK